MPFPSKTTAPSVALKQNKVGRSPNLPWPVIIFVLFICMPVTIAMFVGTYLITPYRVLMIVMTPFLLLRLYRTAQSGFLAPDVMILAYGAWCILCFNLNLASPIERSGQFFLETICAYLLGRLYVRRISDVKKLVKMIFVIAAIALVLAIPESVFRQKFILDITGSITGMPYDKYLGNSNIRLGLRRAQTFFSNPILYGLFCVSIVSFIWYYVNSISGRIWRIIVLFGNAFFSLSTAPLLSFNVQVIMIATEMFTRGLRNRWSYVLAAVLVLMVYVELTTNGGVIGLLLNYLTFNIGSSYNRIHIWNWGWFNILNNPVFGMDPDQWIRPRYMKASVDNFWIVVGLQGGLPAMILLVTAIGLVFRRMAKVEATLLPPDFEPTRTAWFFSILSFAFSGFSVMFFGVLQPFFFFMLGIGAGLSHRYTMMGRSRQAMTKGRRIAPNYPALTSNTPH